VRGNNDREASARLLPETAVLEVGGARLFVKMLRVSRGMVVGRLRRLLTPSPSGA
jgi:hypothetical protein